MYRFIRDNNKKFMAVFAAVLMVAFLLPAGLAGMNDNNKIVRTTLADGTKVTVADYKRAEESWRLLQQAVVRPASFSENVPLFAYLGDVSERDIYMATQGQTGAMPFSIVGNYQTFLLLLKEAEIAGIVVGDERLNEVMATDVKIRVPVDAGTERRVREAVRDFLMVQASYARVASMAKASAPMRQRSIAQRSLKVSADVVAFDSSVPTATPTSQPTLEKLQAHFEKYRDVAPGQPSAESLGFGYKLPDAVKVQTLTIAAASVKEAVEKSKTPRQWDVETRTYVLKNIAQFPATQPASTQAAPLPGTPGYDMTAVPPSTQPKARTYDDLSAEQKAQARTAVMTPAVEALSSRIVSYANERFAKDYAAANPATRPSAMPSTMPTTAAAGGFLSYEYLEQVAQDVQKQFGVLPTVTNYADWLDRAGATGLRGIGAARTQAGANGETFATVALNVQPISGGTPPVALRLNEFTRQMSDFDGNLYFARVTDARKSQPAPSLDAIRELVTADVARQDALDNATADAKKLVEAAKTTDFTGAATAAGRTVLKVGPIDSQDNFGTIAGLDVAQADRAAFFGGIGKLLSAETKDATGRPVGTILLPAAGTVLAVNLTAATVQPSPNGEFLDQLAASLLDERDMNAMVTRDWFSFDRVASRIGFKGDRPGDAGEPQ